MTEMIFNGMFNNLTVPQCVALISCFVCDEKSNEMQTIGEELSGPLRQMQVSECMYVPQCVALISCIVCDEMSNEMQTIGEELPGPCDKSRSVNACT